MTSVTTSKTITFGRPVCALATLTALSTASAPLLQKKKRGRPAGTTRLCSRSASSIARSCAPNTFCCACTTVAACACASMAGWGGRGER
eukprot:351829-Chlamydomonas_euryale.AAC.1